MSFTYYIYIYLKGKIVDKWFEKDSLWFKVCLPKEYLKYIVPKGFIAVDGTSLTICEVGSDWFTFMMIPHTQDHTIIPLKTVGEELNIEFWLKIPNLISKFIILM